MNHTEFINKVFTADEVHSLKDKPVLVALSGGADSVALLRVLLEVGCTCHAAHCNFHLRGEESMRDEQFVRDLSQRLGVPLSVKDCDVTAWQQEHGGSVEMACRALRYTWFEQEREQQGCDVIAVAHHADDQVETFFLNLMRGTGLRGLTGMEQLSGNIWRPLLKASRKDILDYLASIGQDYVTDSTNAQNDYRRNRIRNIVLPAITTQFPDASPRILDTMGNLGSDLQLLNILVKDVLPDAFHISADALCNHPQAPTLLYHRIRHLGFNRHQCSQAVDAARQGHYGRYFNGEGHILHVNRQSLDITPTVEPSDIEIPIDLNNDVLSPVHITISHGGMPFSPLMCDGKNKVAFNTQLARCKHIVLRHWKRGDRIKPFGMRGSKLVSDLFADQKLDYQEKQNTWLLEADGDILWVLGHRAAALYPVEPESQDYLLMHLF